MARKQMRWHLQAGYLSGPPNPFLPSRWSRAERWRRHEGGRSRLAASEGGGCVCALSPSPSLFFLSLIFTSSLYVLFKFSAPPRTDSHCEAEAPPNLHKHGEAVIKRSKNILGSSYSPPPTTTKYYDTSQENTAQNVDYTRGSVRKESFYNSEKHHSGSCRCKGESFTSTSVLARERRNETKERKEQKHLKIVNLRYP